MPRCKFFISALQAFRQKIHEYGITGFNELLSYYEIKQTKMSFDSLIETIDAPLTALGRTTCLKDIVKHRKHFLIDSGAYSAASSGKSIDVKEFIAWHKDLAQAIPEIEFKAGLDDLNSPEVSYRNQMLTDEAGLNLFPTYHRKDPIETLRWIQKGNYKIMGFGGLAGGGLTEEDAITDWIENAFEEICIDGKTTIDVHLFGVSNVRIIHQFPAFSNDSASVLFTAGWGSTWVPYLDPHTHKPDWTNAMVRLAISKESPSRANIGGHYLTMRKGQQEVIAQFMHDEGFDVQKIIDNYEDRGAWTAKMMIRQAENYPENVVFKRRAKDFDFF